MQSHVGLYTEWRVNCQLVCFVCFQVVKYKTLSELVQQAQCSKKLKIRRGVVCVSFIMVKSRRSFNFFSQSRFSHLKTNTHFPAEALLCGFREISLENE